MPPAVSIETDVFSLLALAAGSFAFGIIMMWLVFRRRQRRRSTDAADQGGLYVLFSRLSHQLKTAGEVIRGHLHGLSDELPRDAERWRVGRRAIAEEARGLDDLVNSLDLVVRLGMGEQPLVMEPVNVAGLLEDVMVDLGPAAEGKGVLLGGILNTGGHRIQHISADPLALKEVFRNLIENAVKHNEVGTEVTAEISQHGRQLDVRIADNGKGVSEDVLGRIFEKGGRDYRPGVARGTGMGLYLCRLLIQLHGGSITAKSVSGQGTEFRISLPIRRVR